MYGVRYIESVVERVILELNVFNIILFIDEVYEKDWSSKLKGKVCVNEKRGVILKFF